jgi:cytidylate kinase
MWFSIQTLERASYHVVTAEDIVRRDKKSLLACYVSYAVSNYPAINAKVDSMVLAQAYLKRGIVVLAVLAGWIVGNYLYPTVAHLMTLLKAYILGLC